MDDDSASAAPDHKKNGTHNKNRKILEGLIHWCDAEMMYGSSTISQNNKCAVGKS
jgi:hypothetical protein